MEKWNKRNSISAINGEKNRTNRIGIDPTRKKEKSHLLGKYIK